MSDDYKKSITYILQQNTRQFESVLQRDAAKIRLRVEQKFRPPFSIPAKSTFSAQNSDLVYGRFAGKLKDFLNEVLVPIFSTKKSN